jgi:hypothetical protein
LYHFTLASVGFSVTCLVSGFFAWFWQFLVGRLSTILLAKLHVSQIMSLLIDKQQPVSAI